MFTTEWITTTKARTAYTTAYVDTFTTWSTIYGTGSNPYRLTRTAIVTTTPRVSFAKTGWRFRFMVVMIVFLAVAVAAAVSLCLQDFWNKRRNRLRGVLAGGTYAAVGPSTEH